MMLRGGRAGGGSIFEVDVRDTWTMVEDFHSGFRTYRDGYSVGMRMPEEHNYEESPARNSRRADQVTCCHLLSTCPSLHIYR